MNFQKLPAQWARFKRHFVRFTWGGAWAAVLPRGSPPKHDPILLRRPLCCGQRKDHPDLSHCLLISLRCIEPADRLAQFFGQPGCGLVITSCCHVGGADWRTEKDDSLGFIGKSLDGSPDRPSPHVPGSHPGSDLGHPGHVFAAGHPSTTSLIPAGLRSRGDIIPLEGRGRYFGTRNFIMGVAGIVTALVVGHAITAIGSPLGYELAFLAAVALSLVSMYFFSRLRDHTQEAGKVKTEHSTLSQIFQSVKGQKSFILFCVFTAFWNFSLNIAGPFFNVYMVDSLRMTAATIGVVTVTNTVAGLLVQRRIGRISDKWGNRTLAIITIFLIPLVPLVWGLWAKQTWQILLIECLSGVLWGAYNLVSFNILLTQTPSEQRARFSAVYQIVVTLSLAGGAALGSLLFSSIAFKGVAVLSAIGRWISGLLFLILVREVAPPSLSALDEPEEQLDNPLEDNQNQ